jgi:GNAT superfamily N-acetyltransferase
VPLWSVAQRQRGISEQPCEVTLGGGVQRGQQALFLQSSLFNPGTYLAAVEEATGAYVGLVRVGMARRWAKLAFVGVRPGHRRRGLGRAMVAAAFRPLRDDGMNLVLVEADAADASSQALLAGFRARRTGGTYELVRDAPT